MAKGVALVLFVKNEFPDLCAWLAWHFALGVDTIIVYDDHSKDGTWEAAIAASRCLDVRPRRTDLSITPFTARQREVYLEAIREFREEFRWIGFLDADEFLYIREGLTLSTLLEQLSFAGAVAFSWCIYGSNGHLLKPLATPVEAFTRHSPASFGHNRSVKTFVQPLHVIDHWRDPHTFDVGDMPYVDPRGRQMSWGGPGAISHDPDWSVAKIMHFIPRSMEHFVERIRRRSDLKGLTNDYWNVFNVNDIEDTEPLSLLPKTNEVLSLISLEIIRDVKARLEQRQPILRSSIATHLGSENRAFSITTTFGTRLAVDEAGRLIHVRPDAHTPGGLAPVLAVASVKGASIVYIVSPGRTAPVQIPHDHRVCSILAFEIARAPSTGFVTLRAPHRQRYMTALPPNEAGIGLTSGDRWATDEWEYFRLEYEQPLDALPAVMADVRHLPERLSDATVETVSSLLPGLSDHFALAALQLLTQDDRRELERQLQWPLPAWL